MAGAGRLWPGPESSSLGSKPQAHMALPTPHGHRNNSGSRLDLLLGTCWRSSLGWGDTDSQQGLERR